ncbi:unnamed protein product [Psylliodes chrysocephalus]|uniref:Uncharacterized protein n=1 Tax=Psylliodes chrysocephalus TaxID=3402493 RepID=A0A9P0CEX7_9CUCU|nr:unnamed protein product [Psylliodes chrysocephala]
MDSSANNTDIDEPYEDSGSEYIPSDLSEAENISGDESTTQEAVDSGSV